MSDTNQTHTANTANTATAAAIPRNGAPGYLRLSYALGDDDLVTGVTRMGEFLATAGD